MQYLRAFLFGGALCALGQLLIDRTRLTPARILAAYVVSGVALGALGLYEPLVRFAAAGALFDYAFATFQPVRLTGAQEVVAPDWPVLYGDRDAILFVRSH